MHVYRSEYATAIYKHYARDVSTLPPWERYDCRTDRADIHYDRMAMKKVSQALGHNGICVIATHYLSEQ